MEGHESVELSGECESGWTLYLNQSYCDERSLYLFDQKRGSSYEGSGEQDELDMSMVSDASSGPPLVNVDEGLYQGKTEFESMKSPGEEKEKGLQLMDDTASSHVYSFSKSTNKQNMKWESVSSFSSKEETVENILEFSMDFSSSNSTSKSSRDSKCTLFKKTLPGKGATTNPVDEEKNNKIR